MIFSVWLVAISIQIGITILLALQFRKSKQEIPNSSIKISIIIASKNEKKNLEVLIPKLLKQTHQQFEIMVALDQCTDESKEFLNSVGDSRLHYIEIKKISKNFDGKKYALIQAIEESRGDWLVFTDADCRPESDSWLIWLTGKMKGRTQIVLGYSPYESNASLLQNFIQYEGFLTAFNYLSMALMGKPYMSVGRNTAVKRSFFYEKNGYKNFESVQGGDDDLFIQKNANAINTSVVLRKDSMVRTYPKKSWKEYFKQKIRHLSVSSHYSKSDQLLHLLFNGSLLIIWMLIPFIATEITLPLILFYLLVKVIGYRFAHSKMGVAFNYMLLPLVDLMYAIFVPIVAIRSKLVKDVRWKN